ncbi:protein-tyrosine sulfotransferase 1 [Nilaparvata lugens]|uniref:protein-tyrosine sulfotransferase 1 n=1 Tax=Nilaparvata lugens TaxID=108931 RepID=UPI00193D9260|nr:protein-tyrosine sulfotransferase 1 [Nilaparvata lugens]
MWSDSGGSNASGYYGDYGGYDDYGGYNSREKQVVSCKRCGGYQVKNEVGRMGRGGRGRRVAVVALAGVGLLLLLLYKLHVCSTLQWHAEHAPRMVAKQNYVVDKNNKVYTYDRYMPLIFIGGVPRSGTTLMRAMLDAHPDVRCGQETRVIPRILQMRQHWMKSNKESLRLREAGVHTDVINSAIAAFCLEVIARHGEPAARLCNKDPLTLKSADYLSQLFPQAKFIFMVRDGRATVHSIISRKVTITGFDLTNYRQCLGKWNEAISVMYERCGQVGPSRCMLVYYEQLVLHPEHWMRRILNFLDVPWNESVLHHEDLINKPGGVLLSKVERSSDQVIKPVNLEALQKWVGQMPDDVVADMAKIAPMLSRLGYDPHANPPKYGSPDAFVADNTQRIRLQSKLWEEKALELLDGHHAPPADVTEESSQRTPAA